MSGIKEHLLVVCLFLVLVLLFTLPLVAGLGDTVISSRVDNVLNVWIYSWDGHAMTTGPLHLFQANMNYPSPDSLAFSEHLFTFALVAAPVSWITGNPVLAYNLVSLLGFALCGYTMYLLVKYLTGKRMAAFAAGVFFTFVPYHFSTIVHVHVSLWCLQPLILYFLFRYFDEGRTRELVGFGLAFLAQALLGWYQLAFSSIPIALFFLWRLLARDRRQQARKFLYVIAVLALCMVVIVPFAMPYFRLRANIPEDEREPALNVIARAHLVDYVRVLPQNWLYHDVLGFSRTGPPGGGDALFPGFLVLPLSLLGLLFLFAGKRMRRSPARGAPRSGREDVPGDEREPGAEDTRVQDSPPRAGPPLPGPPQRIASPRAFFLFFVVLGLVCFALSLGPEPGGLNNIFYKVMHKLPFYGFVRFPVRYNIMVLLALSATAGYGCAAFQTLMQSWRGRRWAMAVAGAVIVLLLCEFAVVDLPTASVPVAGEVPRVYRDLADIEDAVVVEAPMPYVADSVTFEDPLSLNFGTLDNLFLSADREQTATYFSVYHWKKLVNGMSGYYPIFYRRAVVEMQAFPGTRALDFLRAAGVDHVVAHWDWLPDGTAASTRKALESQPGVELVEDYADDAISLYRLDPVDTVSVDRLDLPLYLPERTAAGAPLAASVGFLNPAGLPFVNLSEDRQHLRAEWRDGDGKVVRSEESYLYAPFFVAAGEAASASFSLESPSQAGPYSLSVAATDGILEGTVWESEVEVGGVALPGEGAGAAGELSWAREDGEPAAACHTGEVLSLDVAVRNGGVAQWPRGMVGTAGSVHVTAVWKRAGAPAYELTQTGLLPCDVSAGQEISFPVALQAPREPGEYTLWLWLDDAGNGYFTEPLQLPVGISL
ncbi:MAG: glycosyltransferase family 39 protein [Actinomycetota bacterium]